MTNDVERNGDFYPTSRIDTFPCPLTSDFGAQNDHTEYSTAHSEVILTHWQMTVFYVLIEAVIDDNNEYVGIVFSCCHHL